MLGKLFRGEVSLFGRRLPKMVLVGLAGVILLYVSVAGTVSYSTPWITRGDTTRHLDYVWRVYHGDLPRWSDGIKNPALFQLTHNTNQGVAANPPLFYMIHAPIEGPMLEKGKVNEAIAVGRTVNLLIGVLALLSLAWAGWVFGGSRKALFAVAVPAVGVMTYRYTRLNVDFALDALLVLWATLSLIFDYKILKYGFRKKYLIILALISVLGMSTKAPYVLFLVLSMLALLMAANLHVKKPGWRRLAPGGLWAIILLIVTAAVIGWYYYFRNYKAYGSWFSQSPANYTGGRAYKSLANVLTSRHLWGLWYSNYSTSGTVSLAASFLALAGWFNTKRQTISKYFDDKVNVYSVILLGLAVVGTFAIQIKFAKGYGSINFRYMLPALLPIGLFLSYGLLAWRWSRGQILAVVVLAMGVSSLANATAHSLSKLHSATLANNVPTLVTAVLLLAFPVGAVLFCASLFSLSSGRGN